MQRRRKSESGSCDPFCSFPAGCLWPRSSGQRAPLDFHTQASYPVCLTSQPSPVLCLLPALQRQPPPWDLAPGMGDRGQLLQSSASGQGTMDATGFRP